MSDQQKRVDPDVAWIAGIVGQVNKYGGMTDLRFKTIEKLIRVAQEGIESRAEVARLKAELEILREFENARGPACSECSDPGCAALRKLEALRAGENREAQR